MLFFYPYWILFICYYLLVPYKYNSKELIMSIEKLIKDQGDKILYLSSTKTKNQG